MPISSLPGKLAPADLSRLLGTLRNHNSQVLVGPEIGVDAAVIDLKGQTLVATSDPITFVSDEVGYYLVHINANDIAAMGGVPRWFLVTILLPVGPSVLPVATRIFHEIQEACSALKISVVGGHTEVTRGIDRPIVCGHMLGEVSPGKWVTPKGARAGDSLILTKRLSVEGTAIIAREKEKEAVARGIPADVLCRARSFLHDPGISVLPEARFALATGWVSAMHDPTEGGLSGGIYELASAAGVGVLVERAAIPVYPETELLCRAFGLDPLGMISSGSLLLTVRPRGEGRVLEELSRRGVESTVIGRVTAAGRGVRLKQGSSVAKMPSYDRDEISKVFCEGEC